MASVIAPNDITAIVLCGGEGKRMGGVDKPLAMFRGRPLVQNVLDGLQGAVGDIVLVANRSLDAYRTLGPRVISDVRQGRGPVGGIASAAPHVTTPWAFICAGDTPFVNRTIVDRLALHEAPESPSERPRVAHDGLRMQPLFSLVPSAVLATALSHLDAQSQSVRDWLLANFAEPVDAADLVALMVSVDDAEALQSLERQAP